MSLEQSQAKFETTRWTLIDALHGEDDQARTEARQSLALQYWPTIYAILRRQGRTRDAAAEQTQAFFTQVVFGRTLFEQFDATRGRMRALLLTALRRFEVDQRRSDMSRRASLHLSAGDLDLEERFLSEQGPDDPAAVYDRRWAVAALDESMHRCVKYCRANGLERHWRAFELYTIRPAVSGCTPPSLDEVARETEFESAAHVASATKVVRKRLRILLREVVAETAIGADEQQREFEHLVSLLS